MKQIRQSYKQGWDLYPKSMVFHHVQGTVAMMAILLAHLIPAMTFSIITVAGLWTALYIAYQGYSVIRKKDAAGLDIKDYMTGSGIGVALSVLILAVI